MEEKPFWLNVLFSLLLLTIISKENICTSIGFFYFASIIKEAKAAENKSHGDNSADWTGIPPKFALKEQMERGDYKSLIASNTIIFK